MTFRGALALLLATTGLAYAQPKHDTLTIGIAQFPSSLQPDIDPEVVRGYAMGFVVRQITAFDKDWHNSCLLCTQLPTLDNGLAKIEDRPDGTKGMAVTIKLKPGLRMGRRKVPVTAKDIAFTWKLGSDPASGFSNNNPWNRASSVDVVDDQTAVMHLRPRARRLRPMGPNPARAHRGPRRRQGQQRPAPTSTAPTITAPRSTPASTTART